MRRGGEGSLSSLLFKDHSRSGVVPTRRDERRNRLKTEHEDEHMRTVSSPGLGPNGPRSCSCRTIRDFAKEHSPTACPIEFRGCNA